jgi:L-amino acid N-acyltransferase YncA
MDAEIRLARPEDAAAIGAIYAPYCGESTASFEVIAPTTDEMRERMARLAGRYPWIVYTVGQDVLAYAYAGPHHARAAYVWSVTTSVYVAEAFQGKGIGRVVYQSLLEMLKLQGFVNAVALISVPHSASTRLHAAMGFSRVGMLRDIGYKAGDWRDVELWQKQLSVPPACPREPLTISEASTLPEWPIAMRAGSGRRG